MSRFCVLFLFVPVCFLAVAEQPVSSIDRKFVETHFANARRAEASSDFTEAARQYDSILRLYPSEIPELYQNAGIAYFLDHNYSQAIDRLEKGLRLKPELRGANLFLGASYLSSGKPRQGLSHLLAAHHENPTVESANYLGLAYSGLREDRSAAEQFRFCLDNADGNAKEKYLWLLLQTYVHLSAKTGDRLVDRFPESVYAHLLKGEVLDRRGLYRLAAREYLGAAALEPNNAITFLLLAPDLKRLSLNSLAQTAIQRYNKLAGANANVEATVTDAKLATQEVQDNYDYAAALNKLPPVTQPVAQPTSQASILLLHDQPLEADRALWQMHDRIERAPALLSLQWEIYERMTAKYANDLLHDYPDSSGAHFLRAQSLDAKGSPEAENEYKLAIAADPRRSEIRVALAEFYIANSSLPAAELLLQQELEINPYSADANARLGELDLKMNRAQQATRYLSAAAALDPEDAALHANLGKAWESQAEYGKAVAEYKRSLALNPAQNRLHFVLSTLYGRLGRPDLAKNELAQFQATRHGEDQQTLEEAQGFRKAITPDPPK